MNIKKNWDLSPLFKSDNDPAIKQHRKKANAEVNKLITKWKDRDDHLTDAKALAELLSDYEQWLDGEGAYAQEWYYFYSRRDLKQSDTKIRARYTQVNQDGQELINKTRFLIHNIATRISAKNQSKFLQATELEPYKNFLAHQFYKGKHLLDIEVENVIALKEQPAHQEWVDFTQQQLYSTSATTIDDSGQKSNRTFSQIAGLLSSTKKPVRDEAAKIINQTVEDYSDIATTELNAILLNKQIDDKLRQYNNANESRLTNDQVSSKFIDGLIRAVSSRNDIAHKLYQLKAKIAGKSKIAYQDRIYNPFPSPKVEYSFDEAVQLTQKTFTRIDQEFGAIFEGLVTNGQIDAMPKKGKYGNAYCNQGLRHHPIYILLNHTDSMRDVRTLAHEAGHAINFTLVKKQNALNYGMSLAIAETASTFFEDFIINEIRSKDKSKAIGQHLLYEKLSDSVSTIHRQIALYQFELDLHQQFRTQGRLSKEDINKLFTKHMSAYMGPAVEQPDSASLWWVHWPHIRNFFYVYSYASGSLISKILQQRLADDPKYISKIKWLFSVGESLSPEEALKQINIDITKESTWRIGLQMLEQDLTHLC